MTTEEVKAAAAAEGATVADAPDGEKTLSKRERKRQANMEKFLEKRKVRRVEERQKKKDKKAQLKASGLGQTLKKQKGGKKMSESSCNLRLVVDMSFDDLMGDKDRRRCISQLNFCYSSNRKLDEPTQLHIVHFDGESRKIFEQNSTYANWDVSHHREPLEKVIPKGDIVYLSADSENVITDLDESKAYVIGGLVDHNGHKGICLERAKAKGWAHARLPIDEFVKLNSRKVLTINHVFDIMLHYWKTKNWEEAFFSVIPKRKGVEKKEDEVAEEGEPAPKKQKKEKTKGDAK